MTDAQDLREFLLTSGFGGTDYGLSDEELAAYAAEAKAKVQGRRLSWKVLARDALRRAAEEPEPS